MRRLLPLLVLLALAACGGRTALRPGDAARLGERIDLPGLDLEGRPRTVAALTRGKVAIVDVWATWCRPCEAAMASWDRLARRHHDLAVVAVAIDEDGRQVPRWLEQHPVSFPVLWDRGGRAATAALSLERLPTTLVLDRQGRVRHVHEGWLGAASAEAVEREVEALLAEGSR